MVCWIKIWHRRRYPPDIAGGVCSALLHDGKLVSVEPPNFVELRIAHTVPGTKGDTAAGGTKPAELETGVVVKVPLFVSEGEKIRVDTRTGEYVSRAKS